MAGHEHDAHGGHAHDRGHGGHDHDHSISPDADRRWLTVALLVIAGFAGVEVVGGLLADSVALLTDAAHMVTDALALGLSLVAAHLAARPAGGRFTFGLGRAEVLSAQLNGASLLVLAGLLGWESIGRLLDPPAPDGGVVIAVGVIGGLANVGAMWALSRAQRQSLNVAGARAHVLADLQGSVAAVLAGVLVLTLGWTLADPIAALIVCALMVRSGMSILRRASRILLEAAPSGLDTGEVGRAMAAVPGVVEVHDLHLWEVTSGFPAVAAHVLVADHADCHAAQLDLSTLLRERFGIEHSTLQVDHDRAERLVDIEPAGRSRGPAGISTAEILAARDAGRCP